MWENERGYTCSVQAHAHTHAHTDLLLKSVSSIHPCSSPVETKRCVGEVSEGERDTEIKRTPVERGAFAGPLLRLLILTALD